MYVRTSRDRQMGELRLESAAISFPPNFLENTIPRLVTIALQNFRESGVPVKAKFSHIALFQDSEGSDADDSDDYDDNQLTEKRGTIQHFWTKSSAKENNLICMLNLRNFPFIR